MINPFHDVNWHPDLRERRRFALSLVFGLPVVGLILLVLGPLGGRGWHLFGPLLLAGGGAALGLLLLAWPRAARPFYVLWYFIGCCFGIVLGNVLLALFYYVLLTGLGLVLRAFGRRPLGQGLDKAAPSYWAEPEPVKDPKRYYHQF